MSIVVQVTVDALLLGSVWLVSSRRVLSMQLLIVGQIILMAYLISIDQLGFWPWNLGMIALAARNWHRWSNKHLSASVRAWRRRIVESRAPATFRRSRTNLDGVMSVRTTRDDDASRTRLRQASYVRSPGRAVDFPGAPPAEWKRRHPEYYVD